MHLSLPLHPPQKILRLWEICSSARCTVLFFFFIIILIIQFHSSSLQVQRLQGRCEQQERQLRTLREELRKTSLGLEAFIITTQHYCLKVGHLDNAMHTLSKTNIVQYHVKYILHLPIHACILLSSSCLPPSRPHRWRTGDNGWQKHSDAQTRQQWLNLSILLEAWVVGSTCSPTCELRNTYSIKHHEVRFTAWSSQRARVIATVWKGPPEFSMPRSLFLSGSPCLMVRWSLWGAVAVILLSCCRGNRLISSWSLSECCSHWLTVQTWTACLRRFCAPSAGVSQTQRPRFSMCVCSLSCECLLMISISCIYISFFSPT